MGVAERKGRGCAGGRLGVRIWGLVLAPHLPRLDLIFSSVKTAGGTR